jgi:hypothetical protein
MKEHRMNEDIGMLLDSVCLFPVGHGLLHTRGFPPKNASVENLHVGWKDR